MALRLLHDVKSLENGEKLFDSNVSAEEGIKGRREREC